MEIDVGTRLATWRVHKGLTRQEIADAADVSVAAVYQWEGTKPRQKKKARGRKPARSAPVTRTLPLLTHLHKVVDRLGITMEQFYGPLPDLSEAA